MEHLSNIELREKNSRLRAEIEQLKSLLREGEAERTDLAEEMRRCHELVELAADAVFMGDPEGDIIGANQSASLLTGYAPAELLGKNLGALFSAAERERTPLRYDLLKAGEVVQNERQLTRKDGSNVAIWMNSRMMPDGSYHTFMRDNSERKALEEQLRTLARDLESFAYTASHDLKTPLSSILGCIELLRGNCKPDLQGQAFELIHLIETSAEGMLSLIENLLTLARSGRADRPEEMVDTNAILFRVLEELGPQLEVSGLKVESENLPALYIPGVLVGQVFQNLIGNCILYASVPGGKVSIAATQHDDRVRLTVADQGPGIADEDRLKIFDRHYRGLVASGKSGSGLGLAIVAKIARTYGGRAWVVENPGGGSRFCVEFVNTPSAG